MNKKYISLDIYNPGTKEAIDAGCSCPIMDNNYGRGYWEDEDGTPLFVYNLDCKYHSSTINQKDLDK